MSLVLWHAPVSTCSQKVRMALHEKGLPWEERRVDFRRGDHLSAEYLALNPNGVVPTLVHDGAAVIDSSVINEYLEDVFPVPPLSPADALGRAAMRAWRQFVDEVPTTAIRAPSFQAVFRRIWEDRTPEEFDAHAERLPLRKYFYRRMRSGSFSEEDLAESHERLDLTLARMEALLSDGRPWLMGEAFTLADLSVMPTVVRMEDLGLASMWAGRPGVAAWHERMQARPAFALTYAEPARRLTPEV